MVQLCNGAAQTMNTGLHLWVKGWYCMRRDQHPQLVFRLYDLICFIQPIRNDNVEHGDGYYCEKQEQQMAEKKRETPDFTQVRGTNTLHGDHQRN